MAERKDDFSIGQMQSMQQALQERYRDKWEGVAPAIGQNKLLWMIGETGEVIDVIKQNGSGPIMEDPAIRAHFVEEMADVLMYYNDVLLCFDVSPEELKQAYTEKFRRNMTRW